MKAGRGLGWERETQRRPWGQQTGCGEQGACEEQRARVVGRGEAAGTPGLSSRAAENSVSEGREVRPTGLLWVPGLTPAPSLLQIKVEDDFGFEADETLDSSWVSQGPDKLLPYPTLASPPFD